MNKTISFPIKVHYNDSLVGRCLMAGITAEKFISEFTDGLTAKDKIEVKKDFKRVAEENNL